MNRRIVIANIFSIAMGCATNHPTIAMNDIPGILDLPASAHPVFDLPFWRTRYEKSSEKGTIGAEVVCPSDLLQVLKSREDPEVQQTIGKYQTPVDLFMWMRSAPANPWLTRYGGAPFRSRTAQWPYRSGRCATFLGQICFRDSEDLFEKELPGDLLLVFSYERIPFQTKPDDPTNPIHLEWVKIDNVRDPFSVTDDVPMEFAVPKLAGVRFRTVDYDVPLDAREDVEKCLKKYGSHWESVLSLRGTKVGTSYFEVTPGFDPQDWIKYDLSVETRLVGTFYSCGSGLESFLLDSPDSILPGYNFYLGDPGHLVMFDVKQHGPVAYPIYG